MNNQSEATEGIPAPLGDEAENAVLRGKTRVRRAYLVTLSSLLVKATSSIALIITVPLTIRYLGQERYGAWMAISSFLGIMTFADLGLGMGLLNETADAAGSPGDERIQVAISSALATLCVLCMLLLLVIAALFWVHVPIPIIKSQSSEIRSEASLAAFSCFVCIALNLPLDVVQRVQTGVQKGYVSNLWQWGGCLASVAALLFAINYRAPLPLLVLASAGPPIASTALNFVLFFCVQQKRLRPCLKFVNMLMVRKLLREGLLFSLLTLAVSATTNMDNLIIGNVLGGIAVAMYSTAARLFNIVQTIITLFLNSLWPAFRESHARGDHEWLRRTYARSICLALVLASAIVVPLTLWSPLLIRIWTRGGVTVPFGLLCARGVWLLVDSYVGPAGVLLSSLSRIRIQIVLYGGYGAIGLAAKPIVAKTFGPTMLAWSSSVLYIVLVALPMYIYVHRILRTPTPSSSHL